MRKDQRPDRSLPRRSALRSSPLTRAAIAVALVVAGCSGDDTTAGEVAGNDPTSQREQPGGEVETTTETGPRTSTYAGYGEHVPEQYAGTSNWICHPDLPVDPCRDLTTTVIEPDGSRRLDELQPAMDPRFDCFYVYPTTSADPTPASDLAFDDFEIFTVRAQVARYATQCRVFAPVYRQITLGGLESAVPADGEHAYADVLDAWKSYIVDSNDGRGVVLIGHSQGAGHLRRLLAEELDDDADLRSLMISALLLGTSVAVPTGELVGGDLTEIPACTTAEEVACVISYSSYPVDAPPAEGAEQGRAAVPVERNLSLEDNQQALEEDQQALCVNPAELAGIDGPVDAVTFTEPALLGWIGGFDDVSTPFVSLPAVVRMQCEQKGDYTYLAVGLADPSDRRPVTGLVEQRFGPAIGLHLLDANLGQDVLIDVVTVQADAHAKGR